ncbi:P-loop containing nucleoside triphosphate hydrolase protein [Flagelloscypha sp. PMI_526]|nr:P-loop containing nucleoside triphosphate hydrolase protein [Flagelloscypha sp. PMI_526]
MSPVQEQTLEAVKEGKDLIVQAKTGTGKTLAFLLPSVERLVKSRSTERSNIPFTGVLVISPTRELAQQIEKEAKSILQSHGLKSKVVVGGTNVYADHKYFKRDCPDVLVATPGRLHDLLQDPDGRVKEYLRKVQTVTYDEADRILDTGFAEELEKINRYLPPSAQRQNLMFSATFSPRIKELAKAVLRPGYQFISTIPPDELNTHLHVPQTCLVTPFVDHFPAALSVLQEDISRHGNLSKCIVFLPTANQTSLMYNLLSQMAQDGAKMPPLFQLHSRLSQSQREKSAKAFKESPTAVLFSSDVAARGVHFPDITLVLQVGVPSADEQYIHRLGRTARAGKDGRGTIILDPKELPFLQSKLLRDIDMPRQQSEVTELHRQALVEAGKNLGKADGPMVKGYVAALGFYTSNARKYFRTRDEVVSEMFNLIQGCGWPSKHSPPPVSKMLVRKMGLQGVQGLVIGEADSTQNPRHASSSSRPSSKSTYQRSTSRDRSTGGSRPNGARANANSPWLARGRAKKEVNTSA